MLVLGKKQFGLVLPFGIYKKFPPLGVRRL
jgi:hypothetical protein